MKTLILVVLIYFSIYLVSASVEGDVCDLDSDGNQGTCKRECPRKNDYYDRYDRPDRDDPYDRFDRFDYYRHRPGYGQKSCDSIEIDETKRPLQCCDDRPYVPRSTTPSPPRRCVLDSGYGNGTCRFLRDCNEARLAFERASIRPQLCDKSNKSSRIVCCPDPRPRTTTTPRPLKLRTSTDKCSEYTILRQSFKVKPERNVYPHQALVLDKKEKILCNGALISENFVLTAAQCSNRRKENAATYVKLGPLSSPSNTIQIEILYNLVHPQYRDHSKNYDIALFQLVRDVEITQYISPICLELIDRQNEEVKTVDAVDVQTNSITKIEMETMPNSHCRESFYQHHNEFDLDFDTMVCANATTKQNLCQDRVGGSLQLSNGEGAHMQTLVGIFIRTHPDCSKGAPRIYSRVFRYLDWIEGLMGW